jgi:pyruvate/2-oxoglutarate dehydrogenase complex dihydrolipoamide acyltransferase (E2) component
MSTQPRSTRRRSLALGPVLMLLVFAATLLVAVLVTACSKPADQPAAEQPAAQPAAEQPAAAPAAPAATAERYLANKDGTQVTLGVTGNKGEIAFELVIQPADAACKLQVSGTAKEKSGDSETREDENGEMFVVSEYLYEAADCWVSVSLAREQNLAWVSTADCTRVPESCWLNAFGPLRKQ